MTTYRKSMSEALNQVYLGEDNMAMMKKAADGSMQTLKMKDGKLKMDSFTASAIMQVYKAVNPKNKKSIEKMINSGSKSQIMKLQSLAMKQIKSSYEEVDLDEGKVTKKERDRLEDQNEHGLLALKLAQAYGTPEEVKKIKEINKRHEKRGSISRQDQQARQAIAGKYYRKAEEVELGEDGHTDVASAVRKCMTITEDAQDINSKLQTMSTEDSLPSWWTNKLAVASNDMNKMRDYIVNPVQEEVELDEKKKKKPVVFKGTPKQIKQQMKNLKKKDKLNIGEEEVELDEAKYDLYHKDFSSAMQHATKMAKKLHGITIDPKEIDDKVATGPSKPSSGKTNTYRLKGDRGSIQVQVYNKGGSKPFELNMYKEEVELDEAKVKEYKGIAYFEKYEDARAHMKKFAPKGRVVAYERGFAVQVRTSGPYLNKSGKIEEVTEQVELDEKIEGLVTKAKKSGMPYGILKKVYDRGMAAYKTGHRPGTTPQQWAFARVNSFLTGGGARKADADLWKQAKGQKEEVELDEASARADAMRAMRRGKTVDPADVDTDASDDDVKSASKNIMMQLRKSVSLRGNFPVEFMDKKKVKIPQKIAQAVLNKHNSFRKPMDKEKFQAKVSKSHKDLLSALKEGLKKKEGTILDRIDSKLKERKNG